MAFSITETQYETLIARMTAAEEHLNDLTVAIGSFVTLAQYNALQVLYTTQISALTEQVTALEDRVTAIENEPAL